MTVLAVEVLILPTAAFGQTVVPTRNECNVDKPETTPVSRFRIDEQADTVFDTQTGLTWKRCAEGQAYAAGRCQGAVALWNWNDAVTKFGVQGDGWRIPNVDELSSIVENRCRSPSANLALFPDTPSSAFWSASSSTSKLESAWWVSFFAGDFVNEGKKAVKFPVRLTRGKEWVDPSGGVLGKAQKAEQQRAEAEKKKAERSALKQKKESGGAR
jgi:hypothetical protein